MREGNLLLEAKVQYSIGFIDYQYLQLFTRKTDVLVHVLQQTTGSTHNDVHRSQAVLFKLHIGPLKIKTLPPTEENQMDQEQHS